MCLRLNQLESPMMSVICSRKLFFSPYFPCRWFTFTSTSVIFFVFYREQFIFRSRSLASSNLNVRFSEYQNQTLIGLDPSSPIGTATLDHTSDSHSIVDELNIISQVMKVPC